MNMFLRVISINATSRMPCSLARALCHLLPQPQRKKHTFIETQVFLSSRPVMCILALVAGHSTRWPFIFMHNRDEYTSRLTRPLAADGDEGILWARDASISDGGSWLGVNVRSGAFAALTNCRRAPTTVRGVPFDEIACRSHVESSSGQIMFRPDASRGVLIRNYLRDTRSVPPSCPWAPPMLDGYNLLTAPDLLCEGPIDLRFYTNRYTEAHGKHVPSGQVHVLANSTMDNPHEPKSEYLRQAVQRWLEEAEASSLSCGGLSSVKDVADACGALLGAQNGFDHFEDDLLDASKPYLGIESAQMAQLLGRPCTDVAADEQWFTGKWSRETERLLHRDVFVTACGPQYRTRTQSVVLVEHDPADGKRTLHFLMRDAHGPHSADQWIHHSVTR